MPKKQEMKTSQPSPFLVSLFILYFLSPTIKSFSQSSSKTDSVIKVIIGNERLTDLNDRGINLIKDEKYSEAGLFYGEEIKKNEGDKDAWFNRGVVNWAMSDTLNACRDWSAVLALGDTETFKLLDKNCHGSMIIEDDTIPKAIYHRMWAAEKADNKTLSINSMAINVADEMPQFPGGDRALLQYLKENMKDPPSARPNLVTGTVYINFIVSRKGKVLFPYVVRGVDSGWDEEALHVIRSMPLWKPGKLHGKPVLVRYNLPVKINLK